MSISVRGVMDGGWVEKKGCFFMALLLNNARVFRLHGVIERMTKRQRRNARTGILSSIISISVRAVMEGGWDEKKGGFLCDQNTEQ